MTESSDKPYQNSIPIPREFHALYDGPFSKCLVCDCSLLDSDILYAIQRTFRGNEPIVEFAICFDCQNRLNEELSAESLSAKQKYFSEHLDLARANRLANATDASPLTEWIGTCCFSSQPMTDCLEHQIGAMCRGSQMLVSPLSPLMISGAVAEQFTELLSEATRETLGDFVGTHFGMPSDFCDTPTPIFI